MDGAGLLLDFSLDPFLSPDPFLSLDPELDAVSLVEDPLAVASGVRALKRNVYLG